ncbi:hypothetical protein ENUP19_0172G0022 [Entamoeba nuttalli]|uniref:High mobility group (HMG) box domain containing protein n=2 Tax=Entamoeba nuttalli TaxID=412467 RepID=K2GF07_ENTNP|nr:high mobility group (HMG) box domain containing protein [Entamoeba nuttalli P19]EKE41176.1 high mobility group (HMG) box domain containing protein [Entamoeba nuttalli P19]|eukprot:XP_008856484.1 high mobility group (HMG) box domain containing protein [Entamoeba nuttalli P19]
MSQIQEKEEHHKMTLREREESQEQEKIEIAQAIYIRWKTKKLINERLLTPEKAKAKATAKWSKLDEDKMQKFYKVASIECHLLNEDGTYGKRKKGDITKRKEEYHPYLLFCKENRDRVKAEGHTGNEIMKYLSNMWKAMSEDERKKYKDLAQHNKDSVKK